VRTMESCINHRRLIESVEDGGVWVLREEHGALFGPENQSIGSC
jgi:hypothetical protein